MKVQTEAVVGWLADWLADWLAGLEAEGRYSLDVR